MLHHRLESYWFFRSIEQRKPLGTFGMFLPNVVLISLCTFICCVTGAQETAEQNATDEDESEVEFLKGTIPGVIDGDTVWFCPKVEEECQLSERTKVDLWGIDAPETSIPKQFHGEKAKEYLAKIVDSQTVILEVMDEDDSGRNLVKIYLVGHEQSNLNLHLLFKGNAWSTVGEDSEAPEYELAEKYARERNLGLWRDVEPIPPWKWREQEGSSEPDPTL